MIYINLQLFISTGHAFCSSKAKNHRCPKRRFASNKGETPKQLHKTFPVSILLAFFRLCFPFAGRGQPEARMGLGMGQTSESHYLGLIPSWRLGHSDENTFFLCVILWLEANQWLSGAIPDLSLSNSRLGSRPKSPITFGLRGTVTASSKDWVDSG